jgi:hypothetical protein
VVTLSTWPDAKYQRSGELHTALGTAVNEWMKSAPVYAEVIPASDRRSFEIVLRVPNPPPVERWSLLLGEYLHDARSALDALTWELANLTGQEIARPNNVQFPLELTPGDFRKAELGPLATIPADYIGRMRQLQPFTTDVPKGHALSWLRHLNNHDKHRSLIACSVSFEGTSHASLALDLDDPIGPDLHRIDYQATTPVALVEGTLLQRHVFDRPWRADEATIDTELKVLPTVSHPNLGTAALQQVVEAISGQVGAALKFIRTGSGRVVTVTHETKLMRIDVPPEN